MVSRREGEEPAADAGSPATASRQAVTLVQAGCVNRESLLLAQRTKPEASTPTTPTLPRYGDQLSHLNSDVMVTREQEAPTGEVKSELRPAWQLTRCMYSSLGATTYFRLIQCLAYLSTSATSHPYNPSVERYISPFSVRHKAMMPGVHLFCDAQNTHLSEDTAQALVMIPHGCL